MNPLEEQALCHAYGWAKSTSFTLLNDVENTTLLARTPQRRFVVRRYRQYRRTLPMIRAEHAWMGKLKHLNVPEVIANEAGDSVTSISRERGKSFYAAFEYLEGDFIHHPTDADYYRLGILLASLHRAAEAVCRAAPPDWIGWQRPVYDAERAVWEPLEHLLAAPFLSRESKGRCERIAAALADWLERCAFQPSFVHGDLHFGNILEWQGTWSCLDFDDCGFGPRSFDLGTVRLHAIAENRLEHAWSRFLEGYDIPTAERDIHLGTALRTFTMTGNIPLRQDIPELRRQPAERIERYLAYVESELQGDI